MGFVVFIFLTFYTELIWVWVAKSTSNPRFLSIFFKDQVFSPSLRYPLSPCPFILLFLQTLCVCWGEGAVHTCLDACVCTCAQRPDDYIRCLSACAPPYFLMCDLQWIFHHLPSAARITKSLSQAQILLGARICTQALMQKLSLLSHVPNLIVFT